MIKYIYKLKGLSCAGCAAEIEREIRKFDWISGVVLDFLSKELTVYVDDNEKEEEVTEKVKRVVRSIEPDIMVMLSDENKEESRFRDGVFSSLKTIDNLLTLLGIIIFAATFFIPQSHTQLILYLISYLLIGKYVIIGAFKKLFSKYIFNEHLLMSIATLGAFAIGEYNEAIAVMLFYQIGKFFENRIVEYSQQSISEIQKLKPDSVNLVQDEQIVKVQPEKVKKDALIVVRPGERISLDGVVVEGNSTIDNSMITGESIPLPIQSGSEVSAGAINLNGMIKIRVSKIYADSTISKVIDLVRLAKSRKTVTERFITRFANIYTPIVMLLALLIAVVPPYVFSAGLFTDWFYRALIFLVISCPCALVVSIPLSFFSGLAVLTRNGVLIKGALFIENLAKTSVVILDKTGTLTQGKVEVSALKPMEEVSEEELLNYAFLGEVQSNHPLAQAVLAEHHRRSGAHQNISDQLLSKYSYNEVAGKGVEAVSDDERIIVGSIDFLKGKGIAIANDSIETNYKTLIGVGVNDKLVGFIEFQDSLRNRVHDMVENLDQVGVKRVVMLTGDDPNTAQKVADELGIKEYFASLLPEDKLKYVEQIKTQEKGKLLFIGDGINDAPAMALSDTGMAMGGIGSMAAIESADIILQTDEISKLPNIIGIAKKTLRNAQQNIALALGIKIAFLMLGAMGFMSIWGAVFADVGVTLLAVLNSLRLLRYRKMK
ncbi:MAG: heavy metal translocating P-type ATPase [Candidatus Cloacimonadia bacterium]